jgi:hypothetical protein
MEVNGVSFTGMKRDRAVPARTSVARRSWRDSRHLIAPFGYTTAHTSEFLVVSGLGTSDVPRRAVARLPQRLAIKASSDSGGVRL